MERKLTLEDEIVKASCLADQIGAIAFGASFLSDTLSDEYCIKTTDEIFRGINVLCEKLSKDLTDLLLKGQEVEV